MNKVECIKNLDQNEIEAMRRGRADVIILSKIIEIIDWINDHERKHRQRQT